MDRKRLLFIGFILIALVQLYIPASMIMNREEVLDSGTEYKFKTAPVDPNDPFRGKYITLRYENNIVEVEDEAVWLVDENIYVLLEADNNGFAKIQSVSKEKPENDHNYFKSRVRFITTNGSNKLTVDFPFNRFYMEESKARDAETVYRESVRDTSQVTYALVNIKNGQAVLKDVLIEGVSIKEIVEGIQDEKDE